MSKQPTPRQQFQRDYFWKLGIIKAFCIMLRCRKSLTTTQHNNVRYLHNQTLAALTAYEAALRDSYAEQRDQILTGLSRSRESKKEE